MANDYLAVVLEYGNWLEKVASIVVQVVGADLRYWSHAYILISLLGDCLLTSVMHCQKPGLWDIDFEFFILRVFSEGYISGIMSLGVTSNYVSFCTVFPFPLLLFLNLASF